MPAASRAGFLSIFAAILSNNVSFEPDPSQAVFIQLHTARGTERAGTQGEMGRLLLLPLPVTPCLSCAVPRVV